MTARRFMGAAEAPHPIGQQQWVNGGNGHSFVVPTGVRYVSIVLIAPSGNSEVTVKRGATDLLTNTSTVGGDIGGGNGGLGGSVAEDFGGCGGGGAGGYSGNGGRGEGPAAYGGSGPATSGAGGGGGGGSSRFGTTGYIGGGVGLYGSGSNGAAGTSSNGGSGSIPPGSTAHGAGAGASYAPGLPNTGSSGGNLRYRNNISVTPGETLTINLNTDTSQPTCGGCRIIWGGGRSFPSNAGDM